MTETTAEPADRRSMGSTIGQQPSEDELRAAYEAELSRITSVDLVLQTAASLLNLGARRLGLTGGDSTSDPASESERDLEQVRDAIDAVRGLMPVLERRVDGADLRPLRDAVSQLQMAYARAVGPGDGAQAPPGQAPPGPPPPDPAPPGKPGAGPAEASGRLWVPGR